MRGKHKPLMVTAVAVGAAVLLAVGGGFGYHAYAENTRQAQLAQVQTECQTMVKKLESARADYRKKLGSETVKTALQVTGKQVPDKDTTRAGLAKLATLDIDKPKADAAACSATDIEQVNTTAGQLKQSLATVTTTTNKLDTAARKVLTAKDEKTLTDTKTTLDAKITTARKLLYSSNGKVADNTTRVKLTQAIQQADKAKTGTDTKAMGKSSKQLDAMMKLVNDSINKKQQTDAAAKAQAEARAQAKRSNGSGYSYTGNGYSGYGYSGYSGNGYSGSGYTQSGSSGNNSNNSGSKNQPSTLDYTDDKGNKATPCDGDNCNWEGDF